MSTRNIRIHTAMVVVLALALTFAAGMLAACGDSSAKKSAGGPQDVAVAQLDALKTAQGDFAEQVAAEISTALPEGSVIDAAQYVEKYFEGFDYEITGASVDGQNATVSVVITCKSTTGFKQALEGSLAHIAAEKAGEELSEQQAGELAETAALDAIAQAELVKVGPIDLPYVQKDGAWTPTEEAAGILADALLNS